MSGGVRGSGVTPAPTRFPGGEVSELINPSRDQFLQVARSVQGTAVVPVWREWVADTETPVSALLKLGHLRPVFLLESADGGERVGRYSFLGLQPFWELRAQGDVVTVHRGDRTEERTGDPVAVMRSEIHRYRAAAAGPLPRFYGGAVGYLSYEWVHRLEKLPRPRVSRLGWPEAVFVMAGVVLVFDHLRHTVTVVVNQLLDGDSDSCYSRAAARIEEVQHHLAGSLPRASCPHGVREGEFSVPRMPLPPDGQRSLLPERETGAEGFTSNFTREEFCRCVRRAKEYIRAGDIFQVVLSQRLERRLRAHPLDVYRVLRALNPSPYMFYLDLGDRYLAGASPEMLVRVEEGWVETRPIAGTRPRGRDAEEDERLAGELVADPKERAEHVMLVDLGRNDVGRVCQPGTVRVTEFMTVERYSHVMHIVSAVRGKLCPDVDAFGALASCFPAGTLTGAPKVRAMEIIRELEPEERGPYGGAVGYFSFSGNADTCITIRTVLMSEGRAVVQAGAGIVADSDPEREYEETMNKARALLLAVERAERGHW